MAAHGDIGMAVAAEHVDVVSPTELRNLEPSRAVDTRKESPAEERVGTRGCVSARDVDAFAFLPVHGPAHRDSVCGVFGADAAHCGHEARPHGGEADEADPDDGVTGDGERLERLGKESGHDVRIGSEVHEESPLDGSLDDRDDHVAMVRWGVRAVRPEAPQGRQPGGFGTMKP